MGCPCDTPGAAASRAARRVRGGVHAASAATSTHSSPESSDSESSDVGTSSAALQSSGRYSWTRSSAASALRATLQT
eukprot:6693716-Prymnesium_polylepis.1